MISRPKAIVRCVILLLAAAGAMTAVASESFPGQEPSRRVMKLQEKVDSLFEDGNYERAMFIYQKELAPLGDKYAQYMVGYMYLAGKGVPEDALVASAWYRLAAERGNEQYVRVSNKLLSLMGDEQRSRSDQLYVGLRREMGDLTLIAALIRLDIDVLHRRIGSELFLQKATERGNFGRNVDVYDAAVNRMYKRLEYLDRQMAMDDTLIDSERRRYSRLANEAQREVNAYAASR